VDHRGGVRVLEALYTGYVHAFGTSCCCSCWAHCQYGRQLNGTLLRVLRHGSPGGCFSVFFGV